MSTSASKGILEYETPPLKPMVEGAPVRLAIMMFLQYGIWGLWLPILASYLLGKPAPGGGGLGFTGAQVGWILGVAGSVSALLAPFIAGQLADRYLNAERALGILLVIGGILMYATAYVHSYGAFMALCVCYSIFYMPTLSLTNSIAFGNLSKPEVHFPPVRTLGTIGFMVASAAFSKVWLNTPNPAVNIARIADGLRVAGVLAILYAVFAIFVLPKTPPKKDVAHPLAFLRAFGLLAHPGFLLVTLVSLPVAMVLQVYFFRAAPFFNSVIGVQTQNIGGVMSLGQVGEIIFLSLLGLFIKRLGYRWVLSLGATAFAVRFVIFAIGTPHALVIASQLLHGVCYGFFFAAAFLYVEKVAPPDARHSAQQVYGVIMFGAGPILAGLYNQIFDRFKNADGSQDYRQLWWTDAAVSIVCAVVLVLFFPREKSALETAALTGKICPRPECGASNRPGATFCGTCGLPL